MVLTQVWLRNTQMAALAGGSEAKACVVGMTRLLCEYRELQSSLETWGALLSGIVSIAAPEAGKAGKDGGMGGGEEEDEEDAWEKQQAVPEVTGEAVFSKLHFASSGEVDYFPQVGEPVSFVAAQLNAFFATNPAASFLPAIEKSLSPAQIQVLQAAGVRF